MRRSWSRRSAQEPGAVVRIFRLAWWTDHPSASRGPGCSEVEDGQACFGMVLDLASAAAARTSTEQGVLCAHVAGISGHRSVGRSPNALLLLPNPRGPWPARLKVFVCSRACYPRGGEARLYWRGGRLSRAKHVETGACRTAAVLLQCEGHDMRAPRTTGARLSKSRASHGHRSRRAPAKRRTRASSPPRSPRAIRSSPAWSAASSSASRTRSS